MTVPTGKTLADVKHLHVAVVDNGFIVTDGSGYPGECGNRWVFANSWTLERWMSSWGEAHHPVDDLIVEDEESSSKAASDGNCSLGNFDMDRASDRDGCAEYQPRKRFNFTVNIGNFSVLFDSSTSGDEALEGLRCLHSARGAFVAARLRDVDKSNEDDVWFTSFAALLVYILAEYPGLLSGHEAIDLLPL